MDKMSVNVKKDCAIVSFVDDVFTEDLVVQGLRSLDCARHVEVCVSMYTNARCCWGIW